MQLYDWSERPKAEQKKISAKNKADKQRRLDNRLKREAREGPRVTQLRKSVRFLRTVLGQLASSKQHMFMARTMGRISNEVEKESEQWMEKMVPHYREIERRVFNDYPLLLRCERALRKQGVKISPWSNRKNVEQVIAREAHK
jgi:hypothetical protein